MGGASALQGQGNVEVTDSVWSQAAWLQISDAMFSLDDLKEAY